MNCNCNQPLADSLQPITSDAIAPTIAQYQEMLPEWHKQLTESITPPPREPCAIETAKELCDVCHIRLKPQAVELLHDHDTPQQFYRRLNEGGYLADARRVLAHALPKRRAIWWGCLVAMDVDAHASSPQISQALPHIVRFVVQPTEENRRVALEAGKQAGVNSLAGCLAMAAFFSGGSVSLPHLPMVHPRAFVTGRLVGVTVYLASVIRNAAHYKDHLRAYLHLGEQIARGQLLWQPDDIEDHDPVLRCDQPHPTNSTSPHHAAANDPANAQPGILSRGE